MVDQVGDRYRLSAELRNAAGPFWSHSWSLHAFVSHLVSHFDDPLEHLLDDSLDDDPGLFDVSLDFCQLLADQYQREFMSLPAEWYRKLFRSKLISLDVPEDLIREARLSYLTATYDLPLSCGSLIRLLERLEGNLGTKYAEKLATASSSQPEMGWALLEETVVALVQVDGLDQEELDIWMDELLLWEQD